MSTTDARTGPGPAAAPPSVVLDALLAWPHRDGAAVHALIRVRGTLDPDRPGPERPDPGSSGPHLGPGALRWTVVASQLRDNPPGYDILGDLAGLATAVCAQLIGPAIDRAQIDWYAHHGQFSSYDPTGPQTLTRVPLRWDGTIYLPHALVDEQLLDPAATDEALTAWSLDPVDEVLTAQHWALPDPRRAEA